jgi:hypothetical protein
VKLLERSVEELECTINVLEDKVSFERELIHTHPTYTCTTIMPH